MLQWIVMRGLGAGGMGGVGMGGVGGGRVGLEQVPDAAGEVALEAADCFAAGLAFGLLAGEVADCACEPGACGVRGKDPA